MKIFSTNITGGSVRKVQGQTTESYIAEKSDATDTEVSHTIDRQDSIRFSASPDFPVRTSLVDAVRERVESGGYNQQDVIEKTAEKIVESPIMNESISQGNREAAFTERVRTGTVTDIQEQVGTGYYDQADMVVKVAESVMTALGI